MVIVLARDSPRGLDARLHLPAREALKSLLYLLRQYRIGGRFFSSGLLKLDRAAPTGPLNVVSSLFRITATCGDPAGLLRIGIGGSRKSELFHLFCHETVAGLLSSTMKDSASLTLLFVDKVEQA
jgi:hypothetical protein